MGANAAGKTAFLTLTLLRDFEMTPVKVKKLLLEEELWGLTDRCRLVRSCKQRAYLFKVALTPNIVNSRHFFEDFS